MASVNTNAAAITALRTLQQTNKSLDMTQNRISTGYKIGEAKDNAAYWAISTTLKSDNKSLATVKDALGLGAATVDVAYQGLNKAKDVLDEIKTKLTAATQDGIDKDKIQTEIEELQKQLTSIATSSVFSGENWLSVNSDAAGYTSAKSIVSSFSRDGNNAITIGTVDVNIKTLSLTDGSTLNEGILDAGKKGNAATGGLENRALVAGNAATSGTNTQAAAFAITQGSGAGSNNAADTLVATINIDGNNYSLSLTDSDTFNTAPELVSQINALIGSNGTATQTGGVIRITSASTGASSTVAVSGVTYTSAGASPGAITAGFANITAAAGQGIAGTSAITTMSLGYTVPFTLDSNDTLSFDLAANGNTAKPVIIDRSTIDEALGKAANGRIGSAGDLSAVVTRAIQSANIGNVTVDLNGVAIRFTSAIAGSDSTLQVTNFATSKGTNILSIDISNATSSQITRYVKAVNDAIDKVTTAAATLGSVASRIDMQSSFVDTLMDTINKGVGNLIDADMSEESTKLQALQVKQQLGVQALSIANQSSQNILSLFRS